jgi:hypothetical protein
MGRLHFSICVRPAGKPREYGTTRGHRRRNEDMSTFKKIVWAIVGIVWGLGPILYILVAEGALW